MEVKIYDTTLRDGTQAEDFCFSADDKVRIALKLDDLGIHYIEGGWPGSNPKDADFFREIRNYQLKQARIAAFGSTYHPKFDRCLRPQPQGPAGSRYRTGDDIREKLDGPCKRRPAYHPRTQPRDSFSTASPFCASRARPSSTMPNISSTDSETIRNMPLPPWERPWRPAPSASFFATPTGGACPAASGTP